MKKLVLLFIISVKLLSAQWITDKELDQITSKGIKHVYNLEFSKAEIIFQEIINKYPNHPSGYFFDAMIDWWKMILSIDDKTYDKEFVAKLNKVIEMCDIQLKKNPDELTAMFFKGGALGYRGRLRVNRKEWFSAANDGRIALPIVQHAFKVSPKNEDILLGIGIYNYYAAVIPDQYPIVKPIMLLFPKGNREKGIEMLEVASRKAKYAKYESKYFLMQLHYQFEKDYRTSLKIAQELSNEFPNNAQFKRYIGRNQVSLGQWDNFFQTYTELIINSETIKELPEQSRIVIQREANYYLGIYWMELHDWNNSLKHFYKCDELSRSLDKDGSSGFMALSNLKIGIIYDRQLKRNLAINQYKKVLKLPDFENSQNKAEQYIRIPNL